MEPIVRKYGAKRSGYIDDVKSIYVAGDIQTAWKKLKEDYLELLESGELEGFPFNPKKTEV